MMSEYMAEMQLDTTRRFNNTVCPTSGHPVDIRLVLSIAIILFALNLIGFPRRAAYYAASAVSAFTGAVTISGGRRMFQAITVLAVACHDRHVWPSAFALLISDEVGQHPRIEQALRSACFNISVLLQLAVPVLQSITERDISQAIALTGLGLTIYCTVSEDLVMRYRHVQGQLYGYLAGMIAIGIGAPLLVRFTEFRLIAKTAMRVFEESVAFVIWYFIGNPTLPNPTGIFELRIGVSCVLAVHFTTAAFFITAPLAVAYVVVVLARRIAAGGNRMMLGLRRG
ncbi:hypothetical protein CYLTODRAFT_447651 [Cylindrobasidium torrendii FP15055 ss-10]|uniref:Uncharacterized protein n=1 Tax=Cylindrobasidium torrendii FP15055 ss-10 TaxID=1314674 RepID=A0A0D7AT83_9AGAR|nr:hypothetical protein CYLTODRAFT_447651 [Cylindrobasidium torrendii FP15055 ss-10]